jgi:predicted transcriptional regulator
MTERERVERFEAAYNRIDRSLTELLDRKVDPRKHTFGARVRLAASRHRRLARWAEYLHEIGDLRNALVHSRTGEDHYIAVPSEETVRELETIEQRLFAPEKVLPRFQRPVRTLRTDQTLADAMQLVRGDGYSRYPVYDGDRFAGLLTSNGLARWCAERLQDGVLHVDARRVRVGEVLAADHRRQSAAFVAHDALVDDVETLFSDRPNLEAAIITPCARESERPLGMICAADIAALKR